MPKPLPSISDAEWQVMEVVWAHAEPITANEIVARLESSTAWKDKTIKTMLNRLVKKGALGYEAEGKRYLYKPRLPRDKARKGAMDHLVSTFFGGSASGAVLALLEQPGIEIPPEDLRRMQTLSEHARKEGR